MKFERVREYSKQSQIVAAYDNVADSFEIFIDALNEYFKDAVPIANSEVTFREATKSFCKFMIRYGDLYVRLITSLESFLAIDLKSNVKTSGAENGDVKQLNITTERIALLLLQLILFQKSAAFAKNEEVAVKKHVLTIIDLVKELDSHFRKRNKNNGQSKLRTILKDDGTVNITTQLYHIYP